MGAQLEDDVVARMLRAWRVARPDLDPTPLEVVGRVIVLARYLERSVEQSLQKHGLTLGQFDILATLRRHEPNGGLNPSELCRNVLLTSGGMTNRLDKLEQARLIARQPDPNDRRGIVVALTAKGRKIIDAATVTRFEEAAASLPPLTAAEITQLSQSLQRWLATYS